MEAIKKIKLDMVSRGYPPVVYAVQNDSGTRKIQASLFADGAEWNVPTDATASVSYRKQDGTVGRYDSTESGNPACVFSGNTATIELNDQFLTVAGDVIASIVFNKGFVQIATFPFVVHVDGFPSQNSPVSNNFYKYETLEELNKAISGLGDDISEINDNLQESFVFHIRRADTFEIKYESEQTYEQLFDAADELFAGGNARPVYCAFWTDSVKEYILLPLTSYDSRIGEFTFTRTDVEYGVYVTVSERYGIHVYKSNLSLRDGIPDALPNPQSLTINGVAYDGSKEVEVDTRSVVVTITGTEENGYSADKTMDELKAAHNAGRELYCVWGARLPMVGEYGTTSSNIWGYAFRGIVYGTEHRVNIGTNGISVAYTKLVPNTLPNPHALTINGRSYDGSRPVEVVAEPLVVIVDDTNNSYTTQTSLEEVAAALEAGRDVWCECAGGRFPFVDRWGSTAASHGYHFCGIKNGSIHKVSFGTDGISVSIEAPQIMQTYHLIQKIELAEESNTILFSNLDLRALRAFFVVPQAEASTSVGAELYMGSKLAGTAWLTNLISDASERVSMVEGWQDGGLVGFAGVAPANTTQQAQTYSRNPRYTAASGSFTKLRMYGSSGKLFPAGTVVELWGY